MSPYSITLTLPSHISHLSDVEAQIDALHESGIISDEIYGNVLIATTEAFLNAVHHGNKSAIDKLVTLEFKTSGNQLEIIIQDEGQGFDHHSLPDPTDPKNIEKTHGRGIFIIKNLTDSLEFEKNGSLLKMQFDLRVKELVNS